MVTEIFVGIDISKAHLDIGWHSDRSTLRIHHDEAGSSGLSAMSPSSSSDGTGHI
jgi:hypothetical protein